MVNPYFILGLKETSTIEEVKVAFRKQAKIFHPDMMRGNATKFRELKVKEYI